MQKHKKRIRASERYVTNNSAKKRNKIGGENKRAPKKMLSLQNNRRKDTAFINNQIRIKIVGRHIITIKRCTA